MNRPPQPDERHQRFTISQTALLGRKMVRWMSNGLLFLITSFSLLALLFIFWFIIREALPFFRLEGFSEFFTSSSWYPTRAEPEFGALAIFFGSGVVTLGAILFAVPLGIPAAICLSDLIPFQLRQFVKPVIELLAAIPSVAYGFFALVIFAPVLQERGGFILSWVVLIAGVPVWVIASIMAVNAAADRVPALRLDLPRRAAAAALSLAGIAGIGWLSQAVAGVRVGSGTNALNASVILGIMALPTIVSVSEDALNAVGRELREAGYALGSTRAETILLVIVPAASGGIFAAVMLGVMRAVGETMVVWMASGNAAQIPDPWFNLLEPVRTLTATIAGDMGEADHTTGSARYHVLFAMALCLLTISFLTNLASEWLVRRQKHNRF